MEKLIQQHNQTLQNVHIFPTCENEEALNCEDINLDEVLDESCKGILQFSNGTSTCSCQTQNDTAQQSDHILRQGWSQFTRLTRVSYYCATVAQLGPM